MSVILFAWELGGGMGHIMQLKPLVEGLVAKGHRVFLALRDLSGAHLAFAGISASLLQAPFLHGIRTAPFPSPCSYAQIIADVGFGDDAILANLASAWRNLYRFARPDLIVFDHSPTALLASRGLPARRALVGSGFFLPPDVTPYPDLRQPPETEPGQLLQQEAQIVERINRLLRVWQQPPLDRLSDLFSGVTERFLVTFQELDHYPGRTSARYWGPVTASGGKAPQWPEGRELKLYAYLKSFPALRNLLRFLNDRAIRSLIMADGISPRIQQEFSSATLRFERQRLDPEKVAQECDIGIMNGSHGTVASMLLAGKPTLHLPLFLEQAIIGRNIRAIGAGLDALAKDWTHAREQLEALLSDDTYRQGAQRFAAKYRNFSAGEQRSQMLDRILQLL